MAETFNLSEFVIPGTYVQVRAEGLIGVGGVSTGNVGIVGTARVPKLDAQGRPVVEGGNPVFDEALYGVTRVVPDYKGAVETFGRYDKSTPGTGTGQRNLTRALELLFAGGARTVYARAVPPGAAAADFQSAFLELLKEDVNLLVAPELPTEAAMTMFATVVETGENTSRDVIAVVGSDGADTATVASIRAEADPNPRLILAAPAVIAAETLVDEQGKVDANNVRLSGTYTAATVAGLLATLAPQSSPTNKPVRGVARVARKFAYGEVKDLISGGVLVLEDRLGTRVVRGVTTEQATDGPFRQVTTRRIVDFAKAGIRRASNPFIGRLNNQRVRKALRGAIDGFLNTMVQDEALITYTLDVTATRQDEINNRAIVNVVLQPTFSIDFIAVTLVLQ
ncbi:MAG TPA: phage tail sheath C-terminal domain-containing protein [Thermoanaerobaculia bacterium]|nr:phage tail sheath C-terminal domain-containing protein [Thermoanaerobaculia bacterium]